MNSRTTKYISLVHSVMTHVGHATNSELLLALREKYPSLSATTVHRITSRMASRGELRLAPSGKDNALRYDANITAHDHFMCESCGMLKDALLGDSIRERIEVAIGKDCSISGSLTVSGICKNCNSHKEVT